jgi:ribosome-associated toxin RatA of RatAB toxin-antitoxin module
MAALETTHIFDGKPEKVFAGISKFSEYPKYLPGVTGIEVLPPKTKGAVCQVRYELNIVKTFYYVLEMYQEAPHKMWWTMVESNLMKENTGSWHFESDGKNKTKAEYVLDVKFKGLIPSMITDQIAKANLPLMFAGFQKLINDASQDQTSR